MATKTKVLLIAYYSEKGHTTAMAHYIAQGAEAKGVKATLKRVEECSLEDLVEADGLALGSPTYFSNVAWQVKKLIDESIYLYRQSRRLRDKVAGTFTSSGTQRDAEDCLKMLLCALGMHHRMKALPGVVCLSKDSEETVSRKCRVYGEQLAEEITRQ
jgi:NAD(P)H dehydrogenase (quinone)